MDIVAHGLWAGIATAAVGLRVQLPRRTVPLAVGLAMLPDVLQILPIAAYSTFSSGSFADLTEYANATPGNEPEMPPALSLLVHHLHCVMHSAIVAAIVTAVAMWWQRGLWFPLLGWWSHIVIDVFTHSADYYPSPVFYPVTQRGFDMVAWNTPAFMAVNYFALAVAAWWIYRRRNRGRLRVA